MSGLAAGFLTAFFTEALVPVFEQVKRGRKRTVATVLCAF